jgi:hypothetical protein
MDIEMMHKCHEIFLNNIVLLLNDIIEIIPTSRPVRKNADKFLDAIRNNSLSVEKISDIIKKIYTVLGANISYLKGKNNKIFTLREFSQKDIKEVKITIVPGIDLEDVYNRYGDEKRILLWVYLNRIFYASVKLLHLVNPTCISNDALLYIKEIENSSDIKDILNNNTTNNSSEFNPYVGVGNNTDDFGVENIMSGPDCLPGDKQSPSGISSMAKLMGIDKMINMEELSQQLKNIDKTEIDAATQNIKQLLGGNIDEGTSDMINLMLNDITDELKKDNVANGDPMDNIIKIADTVAHRMMPKIDPNKVDMKKMFESTKNLASNCKDGKGNNIFNGPNNPLEMLSGMMESQMKGNKGSGKSDVLNMDACKKMFSQMGISENDFDKISKMNNPLKDLADVESKNNKNTKDKKKK